MKCVRQHNCENQQSEKKSIKNRMHCFTTKSGFCVQVLIACSFVTSTTTGQPYRGILINRPQHGTQLYDSFNTPHAQGNLRLGLSICERELQNANSTRRLTKGRYDFGDNCWVNMWCSCVSCTAKAQYSFIFHTCLLSNWVWVGVCTYVSCYYA